MNNPQQAAGQLLPLDKVIKPTQVQNLQCLSHEQKVQYYSAIGNLWKRIQEHQAPDSPERMQAHRQLSDISHRLRALMVRFRAQQQQAQAGQGGQAGQAQAQGMQQQGQAQRPNQQAMAAQAAQAQMAQAQQAAQQAQAQAAQAQATQAAAQNAQAAGNQQRAANPNQPMDFSDRVKEQARLLNVQIPVAQRSRPQDELQRYVNQEKRKYAQLLAAFELRQQHLSDFQQSVQARQRQKPFTPEEQGQLTQKLQQLREASNTAKNQALAFKKSREEGIDPSQAAKQAQGQGQGPAQQQGAAAKPAPQQPKTASSPTKKEEQKPTTQQEIKKEPMDSNEAKAEPARKPSVATGGQAQPASQTQPPSAGTGPAAPGAAAAAAPKGQPGSAASPTGPVPLSRKEAIDRAYAQSNQQGGQAQSSQTTPVQNIQREPSTQAAAAANRKLDRPLNVAPLQAVTMPAARPSLTGGPQMMGPMGQPAIQKPPTYNLEGDGERVLSKKKLEDLVRQVTGGAGGEGTEMLDPDVEETLLDVADEFVDNVITSACRLAKLRGANSLELRDIQIVLERNYNIRVPGFASDELRTVKKIQPTQAWTQKMSAVQAAKVTGGKADL